MWRIFPGFRHIFYVPICLPDTFAGKRRQDERKIWRDIMLLCTEYDLRI